MWAQGGNISAPYRAKAGDIERGYSAIQVAQEGVSGDAVLFVELI
jgi:hypothetical protein